MPLNHRIIVHSKVTFLCYCQVFYTAISCNNINVHIDNQIVDNDSAVDCPDPDLEIPSGGVILSCCVPWLGNQRTKQQQEL